MEQVPVDRGLRWLDPACGNGALLQAAYLYGNVGSLTGYDVNPWAVLRCRFNLLFMLDGDIEAFEKTVHIEHVDALAVDVLPPQTKIFDVVCTNPPWINWEDLDSRQRAEVVHWTAVHDLFPHKGIQARLGGAKDDIAGVFIYVSADRFLLPSGTVTAILPLNLFHTEGGRGFRGWRLGDGTPLRVRRVEDLTARNPFPDRSHWAGMALIEKGVPQRYPVPYVRFTDDASAASLEALPVDPEDARSPWLIARSTQLLQKMRGPSAYQARAGCCTWANGAYWVDVVAYRDETLLVRNQIHAGRKRVPQVEQEVESESIYPLLRWKDVDRWKAEPAQAIVMAQDPARPEKAIPAGELRKKRPATWAYFHNFRGMLASRSGYRKYLQAAGEPYYGLFNVGPYTMTPFKVVWRRMERRLRAAAVGPVEFMGVPRPVVPQETLTLVPCRSMDEAHYLAGVLNCELTSQFVGGYSVAGSKGFGSSHIMRYLAVPRFDPQEKRHLEIAQAARVCHRRGPDLAVAEQALELAVHGLFGATSASAVPETRRTGCHLPF